MLLLALIFVVGVIVSFLFLRDGAKKSYVDINKKVNTEYYRSFKDWRLKFEEINYNEDNNETEKEDFESINFTNLPTEDRKKAILLGLESNFNSKQLKKAFLTKIKENHPDKFSNNSKKFQDQNQICIEINTAFTELKEKYFKNS